MPERYDTDLDDAPDIIRSVVELKPLPNYRLWLKFENGVEKIFDFAPYLGYPICAPLKDPRVFNAVELRDGTATWLDGELDMAEETLYNEGVTLKNASRQILLANLPNGV